jgi:glycosyltransferase involved in cell wall biosynthesis
MPVTDIVAGALMTRTPTYVDALRRALDDASAVLLAHPYLGSLVHDLRPDQPMVYDAHNAELALKDSVLPRDRAGDALRELVRLVEGRAVRRARLVAGCSLEDHAVLESEFGPHPYVYVANGVDTDAIPFVDQARRARAGEVWRSSLAGLSAPLAAVTHTALFVGSWHPPNLDAVEHILEFARDLPHVGFLVAGSACLEFRARRMPDNVMLLGVVSDAVKRALLESADVALNPMVRGSGTNLKMVEYLAAGIPTVSTRVAARGLDIDDEREVLVRDVDGFVAAIVELTGDDERRAALARNGRALVVERYDWKVLGTTLLRALADTVAELGIARDTSASALAPASR